MPLMEISIIPIGTKKPSISEYVALSEEALRNIRGIKVQITAMGTIVEADSLSTLFKVAQIMHQQILSHGIKRVLTNITVDDRTDKKVTIKGKIDSLRKRMRF